MDKIRMADIASFSVAHETNTNRLADTKNLLYTRFQGYRIKKINQIDKIKMAEIGPFSVAHDKGQCQ